MQIDRIVFSTVSGDLLIERKDSIFEMSLPVYPLQEIPVTDDMERAFGIRPVEAYQSLRFALDQIGEQAKKLQCLIKQ